MMKLVLVVAFLALSVPAMAQSVTPADKTIKPPTAKPSGSGPAQTPPVGGTAPRVQAKTAARTTPEGAVRATFDRLIEGIKAADVEKVTGIYWNSPRLTIYNYNGTVTRGWEQMHTNRQASYPNLKDVTLEVRDVRVEMFGADGAVVMYYWTQSQTSKGVPDTSTGRTTLVFRKIGTAWKIVHTHASPDNPDPSRLPPPDERETRPRTAPQG
jgi:ketosteroid isomerase-like protein